MSDLRIAIAVTIDPAHEGGYQANPKDRANWTGGQVGVGTLVGTNYGITALDMPGSDIISLTAAQATEWYLNTTEPERYANPLYEQLTNQAVCNKLFDMGVLFGVGEAVKNLQTVLDMQNVDGDFGPVTLGAANRVNQAILLSAFKTQMARHATAIANNNPNDAPDLLDWLRRINS